MSEISPSSKGIGTLATLLQNPQEADNVAPPLDFDTWDAQIGSGIPDREQKWRSYANYHRMHWFDQGTLSEAVEGNINASLKRHLLEEGFIDEETPNSAIFKPNPVSLDKQTNLVTRAFGENVASVWKQGKENGESEEVLNKTLNDAKSFLVDVGELPFASLSNLDGSRQIIGGTSVMNPVSAFENAVRDGAVSYEDAILVQSGLQQGSDIGANRFKDQRRSRLLNEVQNLLSDEVGNDQARENFDALSDLLIREDQGRSAKEELHGGMFVKKDRNFFNKLLREQLAEQYSKDKDVNLNLASKRFSDEEIKSVIEEQAALRANLSGEFEYFSEDADLTKNIRVYGTTAVAHPQLMLQPTRFEEALEKDTRLTDKQKDSLRNQRDFYKRQRYESVNSILKETKATSEQWIAASAQGAQAGEDPVETLDKFLSNEDNYDALKNQSTSILASIGDSFTSLYNIPAALLFKSEDAARRLGEAAQEESRRREVAKLFNQEYGLGMDIMTMVAPVLVDIGATAALSMATMGAGGAAYIGLKTGTTLTAKGFAKGMLGGVLRTASKKDFLEKTVDAGLGYSRVLDPREVAVRELAEKNLKEKLIRSTSEKNAIEAINVYNQMLDNKLLMSSKTFGSLFVTSANRSAGGMFTTIYNSMPEDMSHDEKYDAAIGSSLLAGTITGLITTAFMKLGRGGLEEAFLDGMTYRQMQGVMNRQLGVKLGDDVSDEVATKFLQKKMRKALLNSPIIEGGVSEAIEEGIDELAQTFVRDAALNQDTPLKEIAAGVGHSMLLGGIFGFGATGARGLYDKLGGPTGDEARYRAQVADEIIEKLKEAGAPATADELEIQETRRLLTAPQREVGERRRRKPEETPEEAPELEPIAGEGTYPTEEVAVSPVETTLVPDEEGNLVPVSVKDQTEFPFSGFIDSEGPARAEQEEQEELELELALDFDATPDDPTQLEFQLEYQDNFLNILDEKISPESVAESLASQLDSRSNTSSQPTSGVANEATKQKVKTKKIHPEERKLQQLISRLNESTSIIKGQEYVFPTADIPIAKEEFIDDHLTATEVKAFEDLIRKGVPVDLTQDRAVHGMPDRSMFPKGYYENKSQLLNELIQRRYPKRSSFLPQDVKNPVKDNGKVIGYLDSDGNALFENDPVKAAKLLLMGYSIKAPISKAGLNPAFIYKEGSDLIDGVLIDGGFSGNKRVNKNSINEVFPSVADNLSSNTEVLNLFSNNERGVVVGTRPLGEGTELRSNFRKKGTAQSKEQPIREVRQQITDFFKAVRENPEGKVEALNLLKSPKAQDVLESDFSDQAIIALEQEFNMVTVLHELNTTLRETEGAVEINEDTGVTTPTKKGIEVFKSRLASSDPDAVEQAASVLKINLATSETKSDKVILEFLSDYVLNDPLLQKDSISFREVGLRVFNRFNSFQTNYKDAEGKFYPKDTQTRRYVRLVDPSVAATFDPSAVNFMNDLVLDAAAVLEEDSSLREAVNNYLDITTAIRDVDGQADWRIGVMSGNEVLGLILDQGPTLRSIDLDSKTTLTREKTMGQAFLDLYKKSLRGKDSRPLHTLLRLISGTTDSVSKEGDITKDLALLEDVRARVEATLGQSFSTPKTIAVINAIRKSSAEAHTTTHYAFGEQATPDVPTATESVSEITSRTIDDLRKLQNVGKSVGSVEQGVEEVWPPRSTSDPDILRTELTPANQKRLDNQEVDKGEADKPIEVESDNTLTLDESNILTRLINRIGAFVRRNGLTLTVTNEAGGLAAARARTNDIFVNQNAVANLIKQGKSESVIRRILNSIIGEEIAHVASYRSISQKQLDNLIDQTTDAEFESIVDEYTPDNPVRNEQLKAALNSENEATVQQTKEILIEEKLRMYAQERMTGTTSEANYLFWTGDPSKLQIALEYLRRMVSRLLNLKKKGNTTPEMDMAVSNLVEEINVLIGKERFDADNFAFNPNAPDDYIAGIQSTTLGEIFPEESNATDSPLYELGFNDDLRIGTAKLGTKKKPRPTSAESNIGGDLGINDSEPEKAVASLRKTIGNQINKIAQASEADTPTSRYVLPKEFMEESDPIKRTEILRDWSSDNLKALYNAVPPEVRERSKRWYQGANRVANSLSKKYNITPQQVAGVMAALSPQKDWFLNLAQAEQVIEVWSNYQNYRMDSASFLGTLEETIAKATAPKGQLQGKPKKVKDQLNARARAERAKDLNKLKGKRFKDLTDPEQRGWAARLIAETLFGKGVSNVDPEGDPNSPYMNVDGDIKTNAWGSSDETAKALSMLDDGSLENISESLGNYHKVRNFYNNIVSPNSLKGDVTIDTHAVAAAFLMPYSTKAIAVKHNFGEGSSQNNVYGMQGTYHIYVDAYRKAAKELGISPYQLQSITWEAIRAMYPKNVRSDLNYVESRENIWKQNEPEQARNKILGQGVPRPLWLGTPDSGLVERGEAQVGTGAQKRSIARRGLFFAGRRATSRLSDYGSPEFEDTGVLRSELGADNKQYRKLILTGDSGNNNLEDLLNDSLEERIARGNFYDEVIVDEETNRKVKSLIVDDWITENGETAAELNSLVKKAAEAKGYDTDIVYYHGSTVYNIDTPRTRFGTVAAFISEDRVDAQAISAMTQQVSSEEIIVHRWFLKKDLKIFDHEDPAQVDEFISRLKQQEEFKNMSKGDFSEESLRNRIKQGVYTIFANFEVTNLEFDNDPSNIKLSVRDVLKRLGYDGHYEQEDLTGTFGRSLAIFEPNNIKSAESIAFKQSLNPKEDRQDGSLRYETQVVPLDLRFDEGRTELMFTSLGITGAPIEAGPETDRVLDTSAKDAAIRAQGKLDDMGLSRSFLDEVPEFEANYDALKSILSDTRDQIGDTSREEMPIVQPQQVEEFGTFLSESLERPVSVEQKEVPVADMKPYQTELFFPKTVWYAMQKHFNMQEATDKVLQEPFSIMSSDGFILDGNHRYGQIMLTRPDASVTANVVDLTIAELIPLAQTFSDMKGNNRKIDRGGQELRLADIGPFDIDALNLNKGVTKGKVFKTGIYMFKSDTLTELAKQEQENFNFGSNNFVPLAEEDIHITLLNQAFVEGREAQGKTDILGEAFRRLGESTTAVLPNLTFHAPEIVSQIQPDGTLRQSLVRRVVEQEVLNNFVEKYILGEPSPDKQRIYHITLGNLTGNPRDSVAYPNPSNSVVVGSKEHFNRSLKDADYSVPQTKKLIEAEAIRNNHLVEGDLVRVFNGAESEGVKSVGDYKRKNIGGGFGFYFKTEDSKLAEIDKGKEGQMYDVFLKANKVFTTPRRAMEGQGSDEVFFNELVKGLRTKYKLTNEEANLLRVSDTPIMYLTQAQMFDTMVNDLAKVNPKFQKIKEDIDAVGEGGVTKLVSQLSGYDAIHYEGSGTWVVFDPSQIRIAETTREDLIDMTTLRSELGATDKEYLELAKNPQRNQKELQAMVDKAAKEAGFITKPRYHAGPEEIDIFQADKTLGGMGAFFFADNERAAVGYHNWSEEQKADLIDDYPFMGEENEDGLFEEYKKKEPKVVKAYLKMENPEVYPDFWKTFAEERFKPNNQSEFFEGLQAKGRDSIVVGKDEWVSGENDITGEQYVILNKPENIKSADPVTYDSTGEVIPLSQRFDTTKDSILYSELGATDKEYLELAKNPEKYLLSSEGLTLRQMVLRAAQDAGYFLDEVYHGTTHSFDVFSKSKGNINNNFGLGFYFSSSRKDSTLNYIDKGADLENRLDRRAEIVLGEMVESLESRYDLGPAPSGDGPIDPSFESDVELLLKQFKEYAEDKLPASKVKEIFTMPDNFTSPVDIAKWELGRGYEVGYAIAQQELVGPERKVIPAFMKLKNPAVIGSFSGDPVMISKALSGDIQMRLDPYSMYDEEAIENELDSLRLQLAKEKDIDPEDVLDSDLREFAEEWAEDNGYFNDEEPALIQAIEKVGPDFGYYQQGSEISELLADENFSAIEEPTLAEVEDALSSLYVLATDGEGNIARGEFIRRVFEELGYDGIVDHRVKKKFGMKGLGSDTYHIIAFKPESIKSAELVTRNAEGDIIPLSQRFDDSKDSILYSELGATDKTISGYTYSAGGITVDSLEKMLEAPVYEDGVYDSEKRKDSWWRKFKVAMTGSLDIRVRRMFEQREAFNRAVQNDVNLRSIELRKILDKDFIDKGFSIPYELISEATGSSKVVSIPDDIKESMKLQHKSRKADIIARAKRKEITEEEKKTLLEDATNKYKNDIRKQEDVQKEIIRKKKDAALTQLEKVSPDFVNELKAIRDIVDTLSIKLKELYNVDVDLSATIDSNLGIYITRSYKMFNDAGWLDKVTKDPNFETVRNNAAKYFAETYKQARIKAFIKDGKEESEATALANKELSDNKELGRSMMLSFLHSYKDKDANNLIAGPEAVESFASPLINQLKKKRDIDESIRALLGEETDEGAGFKNLLRTYLSVGMMASNQAFMKNLLDVGRRKGNEWILTKDELKKKRLENIDEYGGSRYKQIRAGGTEAYDPFRNFEVEVDGEPKNVQLFAPAEMVDGLMSVLSPPTQETANDAEKIASGSFKLMARITGLSLGAKTLGNIGFYVRNVISNAFYFGPANGFVGFGKMTDSLMTELNRRGIRQEKSNAYYTELIALDVIGNEIRPKLIEELLSGQTSPETVLNDFEKNLSRLENEEGKSISRKGKELAQKANEKTWGKAKELSAVVDAFYKIALFEHELSYLIDARESSRKNGKQDFYATKTDYELKRLAAEKVVMTSQTYSQAPPVITGLQGHTFGVMFAPFLRFKGEVIRTYFNTWNLAMKESKDSNPVIRKRGRRRLAGIGFVTGVSSVILPITTRLLQGIFYDDDEALRDTLPPYMQNQSLVYYTNPVTKERRNFSLTFINPYSMLTDPSLRAMEHLVHGNTSKTVESLVKGTLGEFLDQQIFARAFTNSITNFDPKKQEPIYEENDLLHDKFTKSIKYLLNEAYTPPTLTKLLEDRAIFKDGFDITKAPEVISNIIGQFKPATTYPIEFDVRLSEFVEKRKGEFDRINSNKYKMLTDRVMTKADITSLAKKEIEGRRRVNAHLIQLYRSFERQGLPREEIYNISLRRGMSKRRVQLLLAKGLMDRPSLPMPFIESMARKGETHIQRLRDFQAELNKYPRFLSVEP